MQVGYGFADWVSQSNSTHQDPDLSRFGRKAGMAAWEGLLSKIATLHLGNSPSIFSIVIMGDGSTPATAAISQRASILISRNVEQAGVVRQ
jgi:hypothetical protein